MTDADRAWALLKEIDSAYQAILRENMVGFYAHGSLTLGGFRWAVSDLDFLVVTHCAPNLAEKVDLIRMLLDRLDQAPPKGYEMSVVSKEDCARPSHPMPFSLHFSSAHLAACQRDLPGYCRGMWGTDPDLAAHVRVILASGVALSGPPAGEMFAPVARADYLDSVWLDIRNAGEEIGKDPVYYVLNLCRALAAAEEDEVLSKEKGGLWGLERLPEEWKAYPRGALNAYLRDEPFAPDGADLRAFARYVLGRFQAVISREKGLGDE